MASKLCSDLRLFRELLSVTLLTPTARHSSLSSSSDTASYLLNPPSTSYSDGLLVRLSVQELLKDSTTLLVSYNLTVCVPGLECACRLPVSSPNPGSLYIRQKLVNFVGIIVEVFLLFQFLEGGMTASLKQLRTSPAGT